MHSIGTPPLHLWIPRSLSSRQMLESVSVQTCSPGILPFPTICRSSRSRLRRHRLGLKTILSRWTTRTKAPVNRAISLVAKKWKKPRKYPLRDVLRDRIRNHRLRGAHPPDLKGSLTQQHPQTPRPPQLRLRLRRPGELSARPRNPPPRARPPRLLRARRPRPTSSLLLCLRR